MNFDDDERQRSTLRRLAHEAQDFDDLQNEIAGREVGRAGRFLPDAVKNGVGSAKEAEKRADALTRLQLALQSNPAYAALNNETGEALGHAVASAFERGLGHSFSPDSERNASTRAITVIPAAM